MYPWTLSEWYLLGKGIVLPSWTLCHGNAYKVASHLSLPGFVTRNAFAMCLQYILGDASAYHSSISNYKTHQSKATRSWDIWHLRAAQAAGLPPVPGLPRCQEGPPSPADFRACELRIQTFQDAVVPVLSACHLQVTHAVFLAPTRDTDYCCLLDCSALLWVLVTCHVQGTWFGAAVSFELIQFLKFNQYMVAMQHVFMFI